MSKSLSRDERRPIVLVDGRVLRLARNQWSLDITQHVVKTPDETGMLWLHEGTGTYCLTVVSGDGYFCGTWNPVRIKAESRRSGRKVLRAWRCDC